MLKEIVAYDNQLYPNHRHLAAFSYRTRFNQVSIIGLSIFSFKNTDMQEIIYSYFGPGVVIFKTRSKILNNYGIFHDAFGRFYLSVPIISTIFFITKKN